MQKHNEHTEKADAEAEYNMYNINRTDDNKK